MKLPQIAFETIRRRQVERDLASTLAADFPGHPRIEGTAAEAAAQFVQLALQDGFTLGRGANDVARLSGLYGACFLRDAQYPQLAALFREDIRADEAWRQALLQQWLDWQAVRGQIASAAGIMARLRALAGIIRQHGPTVVSHDAPSLYHAIDPSRATLHDPAFWQDVARTWRGHFAQTTPAATQFQIDYACMLAFCCGQYFTHDPLWQTLRDLRPESLFSIVN